MFSEISLPHILDDKNQHSENDKKQISPVNHTDNYHTEHH